MATTTLEVTANETDLGVLDEEHQFQQHVSNVVGKAPHMLGLVKATFTYLDEITVHRL